MSYLTIWFWNDIWAAHVLREIHTKGTNNVHPKHDFSAVTSEPHTGWTDIIYLLIVLLPTNSWLLSCRWMCPSAGAFWTARDDGPHTARPPSRSSRLSRDASARRSEPPASPPSPPEARSPRQTRRAPESGLETQTHLMDVQTDIWLMVNKTQLLKRNETWDAFQWNLLCGRWCLMLWENARRTSKTTSNDDEMNEKTADRSIQLL